MSRSGQARQAAVIVANFQMAPGTRFDWHRHTRHQLAWATRGVLAVQTRSETYILPPSRALWIPSGVRHETRSTGKTDMRTLYISPRRSKVRWKAVTPVAVNQLVAELIDYLDDDRLRGSRRAHAEALLEDLLVPVPMAAIDVRFPANPPARTVAERLLKDPDEKSTLAEWGRRVGAGERTLARSFLAETGLPFGRWRILARLQSALGMLAGGDKVSTVAARVGYDTTSAFVAVFRRETGLTPAEYFHAGMRPGKS